MSDNDAWEEAMARFESEHGEPPNFDYVPDRSEFARLLEEVVRRRTAEELCAALVAELDAGTARMQEATLRERAEAAERAAARRSEGE